MTTKSGCSSLSSSTTRLASEGMWYRDPQCRSEMCAMTVESPIRRPSCAYFGNDIREAASRAAWASSPPNALFSESSLPSSCWMSSS